MAADLADANARTGDCSITYGGLFYHDFADANTTHLSIRHDRTAKMGWQSRRSRSMHGSLSRFSRGCRAQLMPLHYCRARQPMNRRKTRHQLPSPHVCEHTHDTPDQAHVSIMMACPDARLKARMVGSGARGEQREQRERRRARWPSLPHTCWPSCSAPQNEGAHSSSAVRSFRTGPSERTGM